jgi:hypothetical protein
MKRLIAAISMVMLTMISCWQEDKVVEVPVGANCAPSTPRGVYTVNLNGKVQICWVGNYETDLEGYNVYRGTSPDGDFFLIGTVPVDDPDQEEYCFEDLDTSNGAHYYYAVSAYDEAGAESDLIIEEVVSGTPRPDGLITLYEASALPAQSGYDFYPISLEPNAPQSYDESTTDLYFAVDVTPLLFAHRSGVEIQDYGYASSFEAVSYAPGDGWSPSRTAEAIAEHMYILRLLETDGYHFAKVYVTAVTVNFITIKWAFQTDPGNPDLTPPAPGSGTGELTASAYQENRSAGLIMEATLTNRYNDPPIVERVTWTRDSERGHRNTE